MARTRKGETDRQFDAFLGSRLLVFRAEMGMTLADLSARVALSPAHIKSLESGRYSFSAGVLCRLAAALERPVQAFLPEAGGGERGDLWLEWGRLFQALAARDRLALLELARKLAGSGGFTMLQAWKRAAAGRGRLVALEGIDGLLLREQAEGLVGKLATRSPAGNAELCLYDFDSALWQFMFDRFGELGASPHTAFERSLLFACERLHRQETRIRPAMETGRLVVTHFFSLAPSVYQQVEGLMDTTAVEAVSAALLEPDLVLVLESDPKVAAARAVPRRPGTGEFFSPYVGADQFHKAQELYRNTVDALRSRGMEVHVLDATAGTVAGKIERIVSEAAARWA